MQITTGGVKSTITWTCEKQNITQKITIEGSDLHCLKLSNQVINTTDCWLNDKENTPSDLVI
jgi:hypothetical protein